MASQRRWRAFSLSLIGHLSAIAFIYWYDTIAAEIPQHSEVVMLPIEQPKEEKIIFYKKKSVPEITPDKPFGPYKTPHGEKDPDITLIIRSPKAVSNRQLVRQPRTPKLLPADVPAPNMVALAVKPAPKAFVPPTVSRPKPKAEVATPVEAPPAPEMPKMQMDNALGAMVSQKKLPPRAFVPPAAPASGTTVNAPQVNVPEADSQGSQLSQMAGLQAVIVGLNPGNALPPAGSRSAQIARAPEAGTPSSGLTPIPGAAVVPGVLSHGKAGETPAAPATAPKAPNPERTFPSQEIVMPHLNRTMSAPLPPSSRNIPASVEARFARRNVYVLVIPIHSVPGYGGDWVMWFAEHGSSEADAAARVSAPIPARTYSAVNSEPASIPVSGTLQFAALIDKTGRIQSPSIIRGSTDPAVQSKAIEYLSSWEFKPALHNGEPMEVDVVLEIPFQFRGQTSH